MRRLAPLTAQPNHEVKDFEAFVAERKAPNVKVRAENLPAGEWAWGRARLQWTDWVVDEYIVRRPALTALTLQTAPYVMFFDVDNMMTVPLSCSMAFDEVGKPITR